MLDIPGSEPGFGPYEFSVTIARRAIQVLTEFFDDRNLPARREKIQAAVQHEPWNSKFASDYLSKEIANAGDFMRSSFLITKWIEEQNGTDIGMGFQIPSGLRDFQNGIWNLRHFVRLMALPAEWTISGDRASISGKSFYLESTFSCVDQPDAEGKGSLEIVFSHSSQAYIALLVSGPEVLILDSLSRGTTPHFELFKAFEGLPKTLERVDGWRQWMEQTKLQIMAEKEWARFDAEVAQAATEVYVRLVADELSPTRQSEFIEATSKDGLFGIFETGENIENLACCSILCSNGPSRDHFADGLERLGLTLDDVAELNRRYASVCGTDAVRIKDNVTCLF